MRASITGGFWALILGGASVAVASIVAGPPEGKAGLDAPEVAVATSEVLVPVAEAAADPVAEVAADPVIAAAVEPVAETIVAPTVEAPQATAMPAVTAMVAPDTVATAPDLDVALAAPEIETTPASPIATQSPMTWLLEADALQQPDAPDASFVDTQPAAQATEIVTEAAQDADVALEGLPVAPAPQATDVVATQTAQAPRNVPTTSTTPIEPTRVQADGGVALDGMQTENPNEGVLGDTGQEAGPLEVDAPQEAPPEETLSPDAPAILRFAADFDNPEGLPVVAVVLIGDGTLTDGPAQVLQSGVVATVAIDALMQDATLWSEAYREAGAEVAMQVPLPDRATPGDVEVAFAAALEILPQAGILFSDGTGVLRNDQLAAAQVMQILASEGRGLVTIQRGLGSLIRAAERADVRVATVSRDIDGAGESNSAILRALDQAAFRARQSGGAVVVARLKPRTMDVLSVWARDAAEDGILMGPVSALMVDRSEFEVQIPDEGVDEAPEEGGSGLPRISQ